MSADELNCDHERGPQKNRPQQTVAKLRSCLGISRDAGWIVVVGPSDQPGSKQPQQDICPLTGQFLDLVLGEEPYYDFNVSAQIRATAESGEVAPGIVAHPPFTTNKSRSQSNLNLFNSLRFPVAFGAWRNLSTQIGARAATTAELARSLATMSTVLPSVHPPQLKPTIIVMTAPAAAPCKSRARDFFCRICGGSMAFRVSLSWTRAASRRVEQAARSWRQRSSPSRARFRLQSDFATKSRIVHQ
jgi:hypothetical protein